MARYVWTMAGVVLVVMAAGILVGCGEKEPPPPETPPPPPPPSAQQVYSNLKQPLQPLWGPVQSGGFLTDQQTSQALNQFRQVLGQQRGEVNFPEAQNMLKRDLGSLISQARDQERWAVVVAGVDAYKIIDPNTTRYDRIYDLAKMHQNRPRLKVTGFMTVDNKIYAFIEVTDKQTNRTETCKVLEGDEFPEDNPVFKLRKIIGNESGIEVEYKPLNMILEVEGPRG